VDDLRRTKTHRAPHSILGPFVEPVQLQVVCHRLWENLPEQEDYAIQWEEVVEFGDIDRALTDFYESALNEAVQKTHVREQTLRRWFGQQLITPMKTRGLAIRGPEETAGLPNAAVNVLEERHLIRADVRAGARWYELAHDRLVDPIVQSNQAWEAARETPLRAAARRWRETENDALLYRGAALEEASAWAKANPDAMEPYEIEFLEASQRAQQTRLKNRRLRITGTAAGLVTFIIVSLLAWMAARSSLAAQSHKLTAQSRYLRATDQLRSIQLARDAVALDATSWLLRLARPLLGEIDTTDAQIALRQALMDFYPSEVFEDLGEQVSDLVYSADGNFLYAGFPNGRLQVWTQEGTGASFGSRGAIWDLAISPDGRFLATGGDNRDAESGIVGIWDIENQQWIEWLQMPVEEGFHDDVYAVAYSPDGYYLAAGGDYDERWRDWSGLDNGIVRIWELGTRGEELIATAVLTLTEPTARVNSVTYSKGPSLTSATALEEHNYLAAASNDRTVYVWKVRPIAPGSLTATLALTLTAHTDVVEAVAFSPAEDLVVSASADKTIRIWDVNTGEAVLTLVGHSAEITSLDFSRDGRYLISGSRDRTVRIWDMMARNPNALIVLTEPTSLVHAVAVSPDNKFIAAGIGDQSIHVWNRDFVRQHRLSTLSGHTDRVRGVAYSPDGKFLASGDNSGSTRIWSVETGMTVRTLPTVGDTMWNLAYSPDGRYLVTCSKDDKARVWDVSTGALVQTLEGHKRDVEDAAFSPHGRFLVTGADDQKAIVWNTKTWDIEDELVIPGHPYPGYVWNVDYSPDGHWIATGHTGGELHLWAVNVSPTGELTATPAATFTDHTHHINGVTFSPDSKYLASGSWDNTARIWSMETYTTVGKVLQHPGYVYSVAFSPNGRYLATGARNGQARIWDLENLQEPKLVAVLAGHTDLIWSIAFSPDGKYLASGSWDGAIRRYLVSFEDVWDLSEAYVAGVADISIELDSWEIEP
jgi:WD40 repeat protein